MLLSVLSGRRLQGIFALTLVSLLGSVVHVAAQATSGVIAGTIVDTQGGVLPGVSLALRNVDTGVTRTSVTEADGQYRLAGLPPGSYDLTVELPGFRTVEVRNIRMVMSLDVRQDVTLAPETVQEAVTVVSAAPIVETTRSGVASVVTQDQLDTLPIAGRAAVNLALLLPGTGTDFTEEKRASVQVGASIALYSTNYLVDGTMNMSTSNGAPRLDFPQAAIEQFQVHVSQAPAQFGGRSGGTVTIVTKSGTNRFTGEVFEQFRDKSLNAMNQYEKRLHDEQGVPEPDFRMQKYGAALGGPAVKDRLHFFVAAERTDDQRSFIIDTGKPAFYSAVEGVYPYKNRDTLSLGRVDAQVRPQHSVFFRFARHGKTVVCEGCGGTRTTANDFYLVGQSYVAGHTWVVGSRALNEIRFQAGGHQHYFIPYPLGVQGKYWKQRPTGVYPPERMALNPVRYVFPSLNHGQGGVNVHTQDVLEFRNDFSFSAGSHNLRLGGALQDHPLLADRQGQVGTWTFAEDQYFDPNDPTSIANLRNPIQFTASISSSVWPASVRLQEQRYYEAYVQDDWRPRPNLTMNLGLRYERDTRVWNEGIDQATYFTQPVPWVDFAARGGKHNISPRVGFVWDLRSDGRSTIRGGYGKAYQMVMKPWHSGELGATQVVNINIRNPSYPDPYGGLSPEKFASTAAPNINIVANDLVNPVSHTGSVGFSRELWPNMAIHADGVYTHMQDYPVDVNINTPDPVSKQRPFPAWGRVVQLQSRETANYRALMLRLDKRLANNYLYTISYTLAKQDAESVKEGQTGSITDFYNPGLDVGPMNNDRRHVFVASGSVRLAYGISLGGVWSMRSSSPFSAVAGRDLNGDGANTDYVPGTSMNQGTRSPTFLDRVNDWRAANGRGSIAASQIESNRFNRLDARLSKSFLLGGRRLELTAQVFNVLGTDNLGTIRGPRVINALSDSFGLFGSGNPRQEAELIARFVF